MRYVCEVCVCVRVCEETCEKCNQLPGISIGHVIKLCDTLLGHHHVTSHPGFKEAEGR